MDSIYSELITTIDKSKIKTNEDMSKHTSFKAGGKALFYVKVDNINDIKTVLNIAKKNKIPFVVLGNGTNILFKDESFNGIVLKMELSNIKIDKNNVILDAGVKNAVAGMKFLNYELQGFEFACRNTRNNWWSYKNECRSIWWRNKRYSRYCNLFRF